MDTMSGTRSPVRMWVDPLTVDHATLQQVRNVANLPWTHGVAVMPDAHLGYGATVGSVIAMRDAVSPSCVGVDIGCGMTAVAMNMISEGLPDDLGRVRRAIEDAVPVGTASHARSSSLRHRARVSGVGGWDAFTRSYDDLSMTLETRRLDADAYRERVLSQVGTLGGGNHFIELCVDESNNVWLMLHSGSRNVGKELAERHIDVARGLPHNQDLPDRDLAVFVADTPEMEAYRRDLAWAQEYAFRNRAVMMGLVKRAVLRAFGLDENEVRDWVWGEQISCHHNYVSEETYDGVRLLITRKGAISTDGGRYGLIPGSMGTGSYVVQGLSNDASFRSASHGAGRTMSRNQAKRTFTLDDLAAQTDGVECRKDAGVLDEVPGAYKDLESVMARQADLVEVVHRLRTLLCVKG